MSTSREQRSVILVEDDFLVGSHLRATIEAAGYRVVGPVPSAKGALRLLDENPVDAGVLDVRLADETSTPVARRLDERGCPYFFVTGYSSPDDLPQDLQARDRMEKPIRARDLLSKLAAMLESP